MCNIVSDLRCEILVQTSGAPSWFGPWCVILVRTLGAYCWFGPLGVQSCFGPLVRNVGSDALVRNVGSDIWCVILVWTSGV